jgi:hypothetical protein
VRNKERRGNGGRAVRQKTEAEKRAERVARLKNKFRNISRFDRASEYVRYELAKQGNLQHSFPPEFIDETLLALGELIKEDWKNDIHKADLVIKHFRKKPSKPFV